MKILHTVESYLPSRHGMSELVSRISEALIKNGHQVVVATGNVQEDCGECINGVRVVRFDVHGNIIRGIEGEYHRYINFIIDNEFDVIVNFSAQVWPTDLCIPLLPSKKAQKIFVPTGYWSYCNQSYRQYYQQMASWLTLYDYVVYHSENFQDASFAKSLGLTNGILIPNGASEAEFESPSTGNIRQKLGIPENDTLVLHVSGYIGNKGHLTAERIFLHSHLLNATMLFVSPVFGNGFPRMRIQFKKIIKSLLLKLIKNRKLPELALIQIYQYLHPLARNKVKFVALSRSEVIEAFNAADIFLFPSERECSPIVIFEAMASKTPFLATDVGNSIEIARWSQSGIILPTVKGGEENCYSLADIKESATILRMLALDKGKRKQMAENGYNAWKKNYTWEKITDQYLAIYEGLNRK